MVNGASMKSTLRSLSAQYEAELFEADHLAQWLSACIPELAALCQRFAKYVDLTQKKAVLKRRILIID